MAMPITVPRLGWNMEQGVFVGWLKADGAAVRAGEPLFTLESEKATEDIEGFDDGVLHIPADGPRQGRCRRGRRRHWLCAPTGGADSRREQARCRATTHRSRRLPQDNRAGSRQMHRRALARPVRRGATHCRQPRHRLAERQRHRPQRPHPRTRRPGHDRHAVPCPALDAPRHRGTHVDQPPLHGARHAHDDDRCDEPGRPSQALEGRIGKQRRPRPHLYRSFRQVGRDRPRETSGAQLALGERPHRGVAREFTSASPSIRRPGCWSPSFAMCRA